MQKRLLLISVVASLGILFVFGILLINNFLYVALFLGIIFMHLFGHGHGRAQKLEQQGWSRKFLQVTRGYRS